METAKISNNIRLTCITDSLNFVLVSHVLAIVNKQTASALLLESTSSLIQPVCRFTFFYWSCTPNWWFQLFVHNDHRILFLISLLDDCSISHILPSSIPIYFPVIYIERHLSPQLSKLFGIWPCCCSLQAPILRCSGHPAPIKAKSHRGDTESHRIWLNCFASSFSINFCFFGSLASNAVFQTISINRQNKDTKNDPGRGEVTLRVFTHQINWLWPVLQFWKARYLSQEIWEPPSHTSVWLAAHLVRRQPDLS